MLFLIKCEVSKYHYMGDTVKSEVSHIVDAETEQEASKKVNDFYTKKDSDYSLSHLVDIIYCNEVIS